MNRVFWCVEKGAWTVLNFAFHPFALKDDDRFGSLGVSMGGDDGARGEAAEEKTSAGGGIVRERSKFYAGIRASLPESGVGKAGNGEHSKTMPRDLFLTILRLKVR